MNSPRIKTANQSALESAERLFTAADANSALVLVRKIVQDIVLQHHRLLALRDRRLELVNSVGNTELLEHLHAQMERITEALNELHGELAEVGCVLKDWATGLVDFPAVYQGRRVWLCWRLGEPAITHWHETHDGFSGRRPVGPDFT